MAAPKSAGLVPFHAWRNALLTLLARLTGHVAHIDSSQRYVVGLLYGRSGVATKFSSAHPKYPSTAFEYCMLAARVASPVQDPTRARRCRQSPCTNSGGKIGIVSRLT